MNPAFPVTGPDIPGFLLQPFRKPKRIRTAFSPSQLLKLEHAFEKNHYVVGAERKQLAQSLSLTETQVSPTAAIPAEFPAGNPRAAVPAILSPEFMPRKVNYCVKMAVMKGCEAINQSRSNPNAF